MKPEEAAALRAPFPPEAIGKIPKGGALLDYVGHAATTDRLLSVDPDWTWEPPTKDELERLPSGDGMWIKLTVCGVTRYGWGDGKNLKEWISDAIRNAAMRFGVALDLWSKEDLRHDEHAEVGGMGKPAHLRAEGDLDTASPSATSRGSAPPPVAGGGVQDSHPHESSEGAAPPSAPPPPSKSKLAHLKSDLNFVQTAGVKVDGYRRDWGLPPLNADCNADELERWEQLLAELKMIAPVHS
jgi:hypothetical protein